MDVVKTTMQDNIQQMLSNEERLDQISQNAEGLNEQVGDTTQLDWFVVAVMVMAICGVLEMGYRPAAVQHVPATATAI